MLLICSVCVLTSSHTIAQSINLPDSSVAKQHTASYQPKQITVISFILPAALITTGALASSKIINPNQEIKEGRDEHFNTFHTSIDNYLQFAPIAAGYAMLINNPEHSFWNYTEKIVLTEVMLNAIIQPVKHITKVPRPDTGEPTSFPSGHTTQAFAGATVFLTSLHSIIRGLQ
jgi:membrane-associated phospholipid phosphatase